MFNYKLSMFYLHVYLCVKSLDRGHMCDNLATYLTRVDTA